MRYETEKEKFLRLLADAAESIEKLNAMVDKMVLVMAQLEKRIQSLERQRLVFK